MNDLSPGTVIILVLLAIGWLAMVAFALALAMLAARADAMVEALHEDDRAGAAAAFDAPEGR